MTESKLPKLLWDYACFDPKTPRAHFDLSKTKGHVESRLDYCKEVLMFVCQGDHAECKRIDYPLATSRGFESRCRVVRGRYSNNHDNADEHLKTLLDEAAGNCWCVHTRNGKPKRKAPSEPKWTVSKKPKPMEEVKEEEEEDDIPEADAMWMSTVAMPDWKAEKKKVVDLIKEKKADNEIKEPDKRENFIRWVPDAKAIALDLVGWSKFVTDFTVKHYLFVEDERGARLSWEHRDPSLLAPRAVPV